MPVKRVRGSSNNVGVQVKSFFFAHAFLLSTKLRRKSFDLKELNLAITDCPLDLSRRAPNQVVVTKCKEKFYKDLIAHFSFAPKRCRSIKVFYPLPTRIFWYLYLFKNRSHPIKVKYCEIAQVCMMQKFPALNITQTFRNLHSPD